MAGLQVGAKDFVGGHANSEDNAQVTIIRQRKISANLNTGCTSYLSCLVTSAARKKTNASLLIQFPGIIINDARQKHPCIKVAYQCG